MLCYSYKYCIFFYNLVWIRLVEQQQHTKKETTKKKSLTKRRLYERKQQCEHRVWYRYTDREYGWLRILLQYSQLHHRPDGARMFQPLDRGREMERWRGSAGRGKEGLQPTPLHQRETTGSREINRVKTEGGEGGMKRCRWGRRKERMQMKAESRKKRKKMADFCWGWSRGGTSVAQWVKLRAVTL